MSMDEELMDDMVQTSFPHCLDWDRIIHNYISYLNQIYWVGSDPGAGLRPPSPIPYGPVMVRTRCIR